ncbi:MAG: ASCH domain-containing protein [archaeon]
MYALSVRKPYADLILSGEKTIEIRHWNIPKKFTLPFTVFVHTGLRVSEDGISLYGEGDLPRGCLVGKITIIGVKKYVSEEEYTRDKDKHRAVSPNYYAEGRTYGFLLKDPVLLDKPVLYKGELGFFKVHLSQ